MTSTLNTNNPIICAVDTTDIPKAERLISSIYSSVGAIKFGLEFFTANGIIGVDKVSEDLPIEQQLPLFLDLKFHDIPNTVAGAVRAAVRELNVFMMTVHISGGEAMMRAAKDASRTAKELQPLVVGVTVLTSLDKKDIKAIGTKDTVTDQVKRLAGLAQESGLDGVVCSPHEIEALRTQCGKDFKLIVPGIRPDGTAHSDQKRVMTPKEALAKGADYLVIGRPITEAENPAQAAKDIFDSLY